MDKDVESRLDKLCARYGKAAATVGMAKTRRVPTGKGRSRAERHVGQTISQLRESRGAECAALVRLAYVRGMRSVEPSLRMGQEELAEVADFEYRLDGLLVRLENHTVEDFRGHIRKLRAAQRLEEMKTNPHVVEYIAQRASTPFPLEQHARASVRKVLEMASMAGALAGTEAASYDGVPHA